MFIYTIIREYTLKNRHVVFYKILFCVFLYDKYNKMKKKPITLGTILKANIKITESGKIDILAQIQIGLILVSEMSYHQIGLSI